MNKSIPIIALLILILSKETVNCKRCLKCENSKTLNESCNKHDNCNHNMKLYCKNNTCNCPDRYLWFSTVGCLNSVHEYHPGIPITEIIASPNKTELVSTEDDGLIIISKYEYQKVLKEINIKKSIVKGIGFLSNGNLVVGSNTIIYIVDLDRKFIKRTIKYNNEEIFSLTISPKDEIIVGYDYQEVVIFNSTNGKQLKSIPYGVADSIVILEDGLLAFNGDEMIYVWNTTKPDVDLAIVAHDMRISQLLLLDNGRLASCAEDKKIKIWDLKNNLLVQELSYHSRALTCFIFLDNGDLISADEGADIIVWNEKKKILKKYVRSKEKRHSDAIAPVRFVYLKNGDLISLHNIIYYTIWFNYTHEHPDFVSIYETRSQFINTLNQPIIVRDKEIEDEEIEDEETEDIESEDEETEY